jgi:hypothetical protein
MGHAVKHTQRANAETPSLVVEFGRAWRALFDPYRPERHYMRGPGPKWRAKHERGPTIGRQSRSRLRTATRVAANQACVSLGQKQTSPFEPGRLITGTQTFDYRDQTPR